MKNLDELGISHAPWSIVDFCTSHYGIASSSGYRTSDTRRIEDARLIAAAPELYECLREAIDDKCEQCKASWYGDCVSADGGLCTMIAKWKAAIDKAAAEEAYK